ncbi:hypothetical protein JN535_04130 [Cellulosimicrobium cellulans]|uniref:hypothetical protein n=1 Tax=Cellulosimicrobium cellulans TaxID=1710 RepID=UPI0019625092|nr:hypothetical protein [Cellulosimicrobium cellulans]MBN0039362.1 hypothetical protein [Cellulosimicrobium cellulans]
MSAIFDAAVEQWKRVRAEYELYREQQYAAAVEACNTVLLNREALAAGIDKFALFKGRRDHAEKWASEELLAWWREHGRMTFADFERQYLERMWGEAA